MGQTKVLRNAIAALRPRKEADRRQGATAAAAENTSTDDQLSDLGLLPPQQTQEPPATTIRHLRQGDIGKCLHDVLTEAAPKPSQSTKSQSSPRAECDPGSILTVKATSAKAVHIVQFLPERAKKRRQGRRREFVLANGEEHLVLRPEETHPYSGITLAEWGSANAKLMNFLLHEDQLARCDVEYYLAYTAKVFDLATKYEWETVLEYDHTYRETQAKYGFPWGTFHPHMETQILQPRRVAPPNKGPNHRAWNGPARAALQSECKIFKAKGTCPFGKDCKYAHVTSDKATNASKN